jgi:hypothetical protein
VTLSLNTLEMLAEQMLSISRTLAVCTFYTCRDAYTHIPPPEIKYFLIIGILCRPNQSKILAG